MSAPPFAVPPFAQRCRDAAGSAWAASFDHPFVRALASGELDAAKMAIEVEGQLHAGYGQKLGYDVNDIASLELTPNNRAYQSHMIARAHGGPLIEAVAALTPCPWLYIDLGQRLLAQLGTIADDHPYADWLKMYSDPGFNTYMDELLSRLQRFADAADDASRDRAVEAFVVSARYEYMFWDQAWTRQTWPI